MGTVTATDADTGDDIAYSLTGGADMAKLTIHPTSGALTFVAAPDYETPTDVESTAPVNMAGNNEYIVTVTATGGTGGRAMTATQTITVTVTDVVNEAPTITLLTATSDAVTDGVDEEDEVTLGIEDAAGVTVVWSQDAGNPQTVAFVDSANNAVSTGGAARVVKFTAPNRLANADYSFTVTATKGGVSDTLDITITVRADDDAPVVLSTSQELEILFPRGPADRLDGPLATDPEGKALTYTLEFEHVGAFVAPADSLLSVQVQGDDYLIGPKANAATPGEFLIAYDNNGASTSYQTFARAKASDGTNESNYTFAISVLYEASAQFSAPAAFESNQRWSRSAEIEMFEGDRADPAAAFAWTAARSGARTWGTGTPSGAQVVKCEALGTSTEYSPGWPAAGTADSGRFTAASPADAIMGDGRLGFAGALDYESPSDAGTDNTYHVRVYNHHMLNLTGGEGVTGLGCTGSALDLKVRIKDAGVPTAVRGLKPVRKVGDNTTLELSWTAPEGFIDPSDNSVVPSTRGGPAVSDHDYRYRVQGAASLDGGDRHRDSRCRGQHLRPRRRQRLRSRGAGEELRGRGRLEVGPGGCGVARGHHRAPADDHAGRLHSRGGGLQAAHQLRRGGDRLRHQRHRTERRLAD